MSWYFSREKKCRSRFLCQLMKLLYDSFNCIFSAMYLYGYLTVMRQMTDTDKMMQSTQTVTTTQKYVNEEVVWKRLSLSQGPNRLPLLSKMKQLWITSSLASQIQCKTAYDWTSIPLSVRHLTMERDMSIYLLPLRGFLTCKKQKLRPKVSWMLKT